MKDQIQDPGHRWPDGLEMNEGSAEPREPAREQSKVKEFAMGQHGWPWQGSDLGLRGTTVASGKRLGIGQVGTEEQV